MEVENVDNGKEDVPLAAPDIKYESAKQECRDS